eukprot:TRINITY_DN14759_c0_g1_i1.p1 TRINITY_DN14759_c0_g1~~TRINITY_DN14759_c0_g1_i1.p1  ORF type:complete len:2326 (+),score=314.99 TRINITY_DN14759_c0_g1_i1:105-7082(+)
MVGKTASANPSGSDVPNSGVLSTSSLVFDLKPGDRAKAEAALTGLCSQLRAVTGECEELNEYVQASPLCTELFDLWEGGHDAGEAGRIVVLVLEVLAAILAGRFKRTPRTARTGSGVAGRIVAERLQAISKSLSSEKDRLLRACCLVLAGVASQSLGLASQLRRNFNFAQDSFQRLVSRRSVKTKGNKETHAEENEDVRACYVRLSIALLQWRDAELTQAVLSTKGFVGPIIAGLKDDPPQQAVSFVCHIAEYVARPRQVPRSAKLMFFNAYGLRNLCTLLSAEDLEVVTSAQKLLIEVCCSTFLFRQQNHNLILDMCLDLRPLKKPQQELVSAVLRAHPALQVLYCSKLTLNIHPVLSSQWLLHIRFLINLIDLDLADLDTAMDRAITGQEEMEEGAAISDVRNSLLLQAIIPPAAQRSVLSQAILHQDVRVLFAGLCLLAALLSRAKRAFELPEFSARKDTFDCANLQQQVLRNLPELSTLLLVWQRLLKESPTIAEKLAGTEGSQQQQLKKQKRQKREKQGGAEVEVVGEDGQDSAEGEHLDLEKIASFLQVPVADLEPGAAFGRWCTVTRLYCEVFPQSLLDVKFDWSKLFTAVAEAVIQRDKDASPPALALLTRVRLCALCVDSALRNSGRARTVILSRPQLSWIETVLRVRTTPALIEAGNDGEAAQTTAACDAILRRCFRGLAAFGAEEDVEISVWIAQLRYHPACVPFFCRVLHALSSRPGAMAGVFQDEVNADAEPQDPLDTKNKSPSLFLFAASRQLTLRGSQSSPSAAELAGVTAQAHRARCAHLVEAVATQLSTLMPHMAQPLAQLMRGLGPWSEDGISSDNVSQTTNAEGIRQSLLARLDRKGIAASELLSHWRSRNLAGTQGTADATSGKKVKRRRIEVATTESVNSDTVASDSENSARLVAAALRSLSSLGTHEASGGADADEGHDVAAIRALRGEVAQALSNRSSDCHCCAYVLLDAALQAARPDGAWNLVYWYFVILLDLAPSVASASSPILKYVFMHPLWTELGGSVDLIPKSPSLQPCVALACEFLSRTVSQSLDVAEGTGNDGLTRSAYLKRMCTEVLLPLWSRALFAVDMDDEVESLIPHRNSKVKAGEFVHAWLSDPLNTTASNLVDLCFRCGLLEELISVELSPTRNCGMTVAIFGALFDRGSSTTKTGTSDPRYMELPAGKRVVVLASLVEAVLGSDKPEAGKILCRAVATDPAASLQYVVAAKLDQLLPRRKGGFALTSIELLPLLELACRVNVDFRRKLLRRLDWKSFAPSTVLLLATILAPLESSLPFLTDDAIASLSPETLHPLPPLQRLCRLLARHPAPALARLILRAAEGEADVHKQHELILNLEVIRGRKIERALSRFLDRFNERNSNPESTNGACAEARRICAILSSLEELSEVLLESLRTYVDTLAGVCAEGAAVLLSCVLAHRGKSGLEQPLLASWWAARSAEDLLATRESCDMRGPSLPEWLLGHAIRWWRFFDRQSAIVRDFVSEVRSGYTASLSPSDRLRRSVLISDAAGNATIALGKDRGEVVDAPRGDSPWSFREWCGSLAPWGETATWAWVLEAPRVEATVDRFWFDRPMVEPIRWAHLNVAFDERHENMLGPSAVSPPSVGLSRASGQGTSSNEAYDVSYVVPFVAGQLRALWAEHNTQNAADARHTVGPVFSALISGGVLEILLMTIACSDIVIRGAALECLSVLLALAGLWKDVPLNSDETKTRDKTKKLRNPFRELPHFVWLLRAVQNSLEPPDSEGGIPAAMPTLLTSFVSACVPVLLKPQHFLYMKVCLFVMGNVSLDTSDVPLFYKLLLSDNNDHSHEARAWMFRVIRRSLCCRSKNHDKDAQHFHDALLVPRSDVSVPNGVLGHSDDVDSEGVAEGEADDTKGSCIDPATQLAVERRHVLPWLLSFASSYELGNFSLWNEAVACLKTTLVRPLWASSVSSGIAFSAARRFGVAEWILCQVSRSWPGAAGRHQRVQALTALTQLLHGLLRASQGVAAVGPSVPEQLALGRALEGLIQGWIGVVIGSSSTDQEARPPLPALWTSVVGLACLATGSGTNTANPGASTVNSCTLPASAQLGGILRSLAHLSSLVEPTRGEAHSGVIVTVTSDSRISFQDRSSRCSLAKVIAEKAGDEAFAQALVVLEACPLSGVLQDAVIGFSQRWCVGQMAATNDDYELGSETPMPELRDEVESQIVRVLGRLMTALRASRELPFGGGFAPAPSSVSQSLKDSTMSFLRMLVSLPLQPRAAWRVYLLASALILSLHPSANLDSELLMALPSPEAALGLSQSDVERLSDGEDGWLVRSSALLSALLQCVDK